VTPTVVQQLREASYKEHRTTTTSGGSVKALTLTQPWAYLVAVGAKTIETRSWRATYRGPLAIHAAKGFPREAIELCFKEPFASVLKQFGVRTPGDLVRGAIIATCRLA